MCRRFRLPTPTRQRKRRDSSGRWRYLDADFDEFNLVAEVDGQHHTEVLTWWSDMERQNDIVVHDDKAVLRFAGFALRRHPDRVAHVLRTFFTLRAKRARQLPS
jgi:very-short-patch-repair endonuclease